MKKLISIFLVATLLVSLASCSKSTEATTTLETTPEPTTTNTEATTTEPTTNYNEYVEEMLDLNSIETIDYELAYSFADHGINDAVLNCDNDETPFFFSSMGYDNLYLRNNLINYAYEINGEYNENISIDNYRYFLYYLNTHYTSALGTNDLYESYMEVEQFSCQMSISRAVLSENNLRFFIDEIPSSYFYERFPEFMRTVDNGEFEQLYEEIINNNVHYILDINTITDSYIRDLFEFWSCISYNHLRRYLIYAYSENNEDYSDDVDQVRDQRNNRHVLVPTEEQYNEIMEDLRVCPTFENIDIYQVETREEYFEAYGFYPEDVLSEERYELNYEPYVSPYEFDVVQIDQNIEQPES